MELEAVARAVGAVDGYRFDVRTHGESGPVVFDPAPGVRAVTEDVRAGAGPALVAARFQQGVVALVVPAVEMVRRRTGLARVTLSGGVFLNSFLTEGCVRDLAAAGFEVPRHRTAPASDAVIAARPVAVLAHAGLPDVAHPVPPRRQASPEME